VTNVSADGNNNFGFWAKYIEAVNCSANDNVGFGFIAGVQGFKKPGHPGTPKGKIRGTDVTANGNGQAGVFSTENFKITDLTAAGNGSVGGPQGGGIVGLKGGVLKDSTVTGNVNGPAHDPLDVYSAKPPHIIDATCGTSGQYPTPTADWGVCSND
jgi:hypothetical protein